MSKKGDPSLPTYLQMLRIAHFTVRWNTQSLMKVILMYPELSSMEWSQILTIIYQN